MLTTGNNSQNTKSIAAAIAWSAKLLSKKISVKTEIEYKLVRARYKEKLKQHKEAGGIVYAPGDNTKVLNKNTRTKYRSAFRRFAALQIREAYDQNNFKKIRSLWIVLEKMKSQADSAQNKYQSDFYKNQSNKLIRKSKKKGLVKLKNNWRETFLGLVMNSRSKYKEAIQILAISGCRPAEIENGVSVFVDSETVEIMIKGAKVTVNSGQPNRTIVISANHPLAKGLQTLKNYQCNAGLLCDAVSRFGLIYRKKYKLDYLVTAYSFRHAYATDIKSAGKSLSETASAMGHVTEFMQEKYGYTHGKSIYSEHFISAKADRTVKPKAHKNFKKSPYDLSKTIRKRVAF